MKLWNRLTFGSKLAVCLFCANLVATVLGIALLYGNARGEALRMNTLLNEKNLLITRQNIEGMVTGTENSAISIFFEHSAKEQIFNDSHFHEAPNSYNEVNTQLLRVLNTTPAIHSISIYKRNGSSLSTHGSGALPFADYASFVDYATGQGLTLTGETSSSRWSTLLAAEEGAGRNGSFVNVRELKDVSTAESSALMLVYLKESSIFDMYSFFGEESFMIDQNGVVVSAKDKSRIGTSLAETPLGEAVLASGRQTVSLPYGEDGTHYFSSTYIPALGCYLVALPSYDVLASTQQALGLTALLLVGFSVLVSLLLARLISHGMTGKIVALKQTMEAAETNLDLRFSAKGSDEINYLGDSFNRLMDQIGCHIRSVEETQARKRASDLQLLQSQINPHLLYNTLDSVLLCLEHNDTETGRATIELLSDYFKVSLSRGQTCVPLRTELAHIEKYIQLQRICRGKHIRQRTEIPEGLLDMPILKTVLQPLVENTFLHAFVGAFADGEIHITVRQRENGLLEIAVADNGLGIPKAQLDELNQGLHAEQPAGSYGLWNVNQRLANHYGPGSGLWLQSELGEGTCALITLPHPESTQMPEPRPSEE